MTVFKLSAKSGEGMEQFLGSSRHAYQNCVKLQPSNNLGDVSPAILLQRSCDRREKRFVIQIVGARIRLGPRAEHDND